MKGPYDDNLLYCIKKSSIDTSLNEQKFIKSFNNQYPKANISLINETFGFIEKNFTIYLLSYASIGILDSNITGPKVGSCSTNFAMKSSVVNTTGRGCKHDQGLGKGIYKAGCAGSGAANSGNGGFGARNVTSNMTDCSLFEPLAIETRETDAQYEGSGGATAVSQVGNYTLGGNGGGIVWLSAANRLRIQ